MDYVDSIDYNELCWHTGQYIEDACNCDLCNHKYECSGYTGDDYD